MTTFQFKIVTVIILASFLATMVIPIPITQSQTELPRARMLSEEAFVDVDFGRNATIVEVMTFYNPSNELAQLPHSIEVTRGLAVGRYTDDMRQEIVNRISETLTITDNLGANIVHSEISIIENKISYVIFIPREIMPPNEWYKI